MKALRVGLAMAAVLAVANFFSSALAERPYLEEPNIIAAEFPTTAPSAVVVDVVDLATGTQVGNDIAAVQMNRDSLPTSAWGFDLSTMAGYPINCEPKTYHITFVPDAVDCSTGGDPTLCATTVRSVGGPHCKTNEKVQVAYVYASTLASGQGINQTVMDYYNLRGLLPIKWRRIDHAGDEAYGTPEHTEWEVYFYRDVAGGLAQLRCTIKTVSDPAVSLPSSAACPS